MVHASGLRHIRTARYMVEMELETQRAASFTQSATKGSGVVDAPSLGAIAVDGVVRGGGAGWVWAVADSEGIFMMASWAIYLPAVGWTQGAREFTTYARGLS